MIGWADAADPLAADAAALGFDIADLVASAWRARVDPYATRSLVSAAHVLAGPPVMRRLWAEAEPCPSDEALLDAAEGLEAKAAGMLRDAIEMTGDCEMTRNRAAQDYLEALARTETAGAAGAEANTALADCDAALDILEGVRGQIKQALDSLRQAPAELADAYEAAYYLLRRGGSLPHSGHFMTGAA